VQDRGPDVGSGVLCIGQEQVPERRRARPFLQLLDDLRRLPAITAVHFGLYLSLVRVDMLSHECEQPFAAATSPWPRIQIPIDSPGALTASHDGIVCGNGTVCVNGIVCATDCGQCREEIS